jgi:hypothetical protein
MKKWIQWIICLLFILGTASCQTLPAPDRTQGAETRQTLKSASAPKEKAPALPDILVHDVGTIWNGTFIRHPFAIANPGDQPLTIRQVIEGEGVRVARFTRVIPPGGNGEVLFEVSTRRLKGKIRKTAKVCFRNPRRPPLELAITGEVRTSVEVAPENTVRFRNDAGRPLTWHFLVTSPRKRDFTIRGIETHTPHLRTDFRRAKGSESTGQDHIYDLAVTLSPETPVGTFRDLLRIHTDIPDGYPGEIFFSGRVQGPILWSPVHVKFTVLEDGSFSPARISLSNRRGIPFRVTGVETDAPEIQWETHAAQGGRAQGIDLLWTGEPGEKLRNGKLLLITDVVGQERIEIPYVVFPRVECGQENTPVKGCRDCPGK